MGSCGSVLRKSGSAKLDTPHDPSKPERNSIPPTPVKEKPDTNGVDAAGAPIYGSPQSHKSQVSPLKSINSFSRLGSKEETFFDAQTYMDSDCDEDFYSVYGGTPSCGSTPVHGSAIGTPRNPALSPKIMNRALTEGRRLSFNGPSPLSRDGAPTHMSISTAPAKGYITEVNVQTPLSSQSTTSSSSPSSSSTGRKKLAELFRDSSVRDNQDMQAKGGHKRVFSKSANSSPLISGCNPLASGRYRTSNEASNVKAEVEKKMPAYGCLPRMVPSRSFRKRMTPPTISVDA